MSRTKCLILSSHEDSSADASALPGKCKEKALEFAVRLFESAGELKDEPEPKLLQLCQEEKIQIPVCCDMKSLTDALSVVFYRRRRRRLGFYTVWRWKFMDIWQYCSRFDFERYMKAMGKVQWTGCIGNQELLSGN